MKTNVHAEPITSMSVTDFAIQFIADSVPDGYHRSCDIRVYDYQKLSKFLKVPTTVFRVEYNYILLLEDGNILMQLGSETKRISAPATIFVSAGQITSLQEISENISGTIVILENDSLIRIFSEQDLLKILEITNVISLSKDDKVMADGIGKLLLKEFESEQPVLQVMVAFVQALLLKLVRHSGVNDVLARNHAIAIKFKDLVYKNSSAQKNVSFYTETLNISENYLNRCTRQIFGKSAKRFILEVSIMQSKILLQDMQKGVAEVAYELNFEDSSYFSRIFRKITGTTPSAYKQQILDQTGGFILSVLLNLLSQPEL